MAPWSRFKVGVHGGGSVGVRPLAGLGVPVTPGFGGQHRRVAPSDRGADPPYLAGIQPGHGCLDRRGLRRGLDLTEDQAAVLTQGIRGS